MSRADRYQSFDSGFVPDVQTPKKSRTPMSTYVGAGLVILVVIVVVTVLVEVVARRSVTPDLGNEMYREFSFESGYMCLNHGLYGSTPRYVMDKLHEYQQQMDANPDKWFRGGLQALLTAAQQKLANYLKVNASDIVFIPNASSAVNTVIRSILPPADDPNRRKILYLSIEYPMTKNVISYVSTPSVMPGFASEAIEVPLSYPLTSQSIIQQVEQVLTTNPNEFYLAVFSHIASTPGLTMPVQQLSELCHQHGTMVLIDGAHAIGNLPLAPSEIGADFYLSNGHKWLYSGKGSAFLWVRPAYQPAIYPFILWNFGDFQTKFSWLGTNDYSSFLTISDALDWRDKFGGDDAIMNYTHSLALNGGNLLAEKWGTEVLGQNDPSLYGGAIVNVRLPLSTIPTTISTNDLANYISSTHNTYVPIYSWSGIWWARLSAQVFNDINDFVLYADYLKEALTYYQLT